MSASPPAPTSLASPAASIASASPPAPTSLASPAASIASAPSAPSSRGPVVSFAAVGLVLTVALVLGACQRTKFPELTNIELERNLVVGQAIAPIRFGNTGAKGITGCTSTPALPEGLVAQPTPTGGSCEIIGTPNVSANRTVYTIAGSNRRGAREATVTMTVFAMLITPSLSNPNSEQSYSTGSVITTLRFANNGGENITGCTVNPALPAGLILAPEADNSTCAIAGTPSTVKARTTYTVTARNASGLSNATVIITVAMGSAPSGAPALRAPRIPELVERRTIEDIVFTNGGGAPSDTNGCASDPLLPNGLAIARTSDGNSCQITGTPTAATAARSYNITATNSTGASTIAVSLTISAAPTSAAPVLVAPTFEAFVAGTPITPIIFTNNGGAPAAVGGCASDVELPDTLALERTDDGMTCQITGTPLNPLITSTFMITATNPSGSSTVAIMITINAQ